MFYVAIAFTLFALLGGMHLLAKAQKEMLGKFFTWISYIIIAISLLLLICQSTQGILRMTCCRDDMRYKSECCMPGMMGNRWHHEDMRKEKCCEEMEEGGMKKDDGHCGEMMREWTKEHEKIEETQDSSKQ